MTIDDKKINHLTDLLDYASLLYYDEKEATYFDCLSKVIESFLEDEPLPLEEETIEKMNETFNEIRKLECNQEELRKVFLLLSIKGFKHANFSLDIITPDAVSIICSYFVESLLKKVDKPKDIIQKYKRPIKGKYSILDINYGTGNLVLNINNNLDLPIKFVGIESSNILANYANNMNNFIDMDTIIYNQDALSMIVPNVDLVVSDLASYDYEDELYESELTKKGVKYFPYLAIEKHLKSGHDKTKYLYLIDFDFFEHEGSQEFKKILSEQVSIKSLVVLPQSFFQGNPKAVLILDKVKKGSTNIVSLPPLNDKDKFIDVIQEIKQQLEE
jgi:site-specific DNA-methyltransferase (adenine-specific)